MDSPVSSSSGIGQISTQHQVFLNYRDAELRERFLGLLVDALEKEKVNVFAEEEELRGKSLTNLFDRIEKSKIAVTIFSEKYTESKLCLDELAKINDCVDQGNLQVVPIFFNVETEDVKKLRGKFGENFVELRSKYPDEQERTKKWEEALHSVSRKFGLSSENSPHRHFVKLIAKGVKKLLTEIAKRDEEEMNMKRREIEELAEAKRNSLSGRTKELINSIVPSRFLVLLLVMLLAPYVLGFICIVVFTVSRWKTKRK